MAYPPLLSVFGMSTAFVPRSASYSITAHPTMPSKPLGALCAAAVLIACLPASAIEISTTLVESSPDRFAVTVEWPAAGGAPGDVSRTFPGFGAVAATDMGVGFKVEFFPVFPYTVGIGVAEYDGFARDLPSMVWSYSGAGVQVLPLPSGSEYGGVFVFGKSYPPAGVPDNGASALLLSAGFAGLTLFRRIFV